MQTQKERAKSGREKLQMIINACQTVQEKSLDPFVVNIGQDIEKMKEYFPEWKLPEDLVLDAETVNCLASIIKLQGEWVKHRSTSLYTDPFLLEEKLRKLRKEEIVDTFAMAWHPIIEFEQISLHSLREALRYWEELLPIEERWKQEIPLEVQIGTATREQLMQEQILKDIAFSEELESFWDELKISVNKKGEAGRIKYWDFIGAETYDETVHRAFMTSFLVTYGYATLEVYPLEEEMFVKPHEEPETKISKTQLVSIPISVSHEDWAKWKKGEPE